MLQYVEKKFSMSTKSTIGSDFLSKRIEIEGKPVTLQVCIQFLKQEIFNKQNLLCEDMVGFFISSLQIIC